MAWIRVSVLGLHIRLEHTLTLCFKTRVCEIVRFGAGFTNLELGFLEVFPLFILFLCTRSHSSSRWRCPSYMCIRISVELVWNNEAELHCHAVVFVSCSSARGDSMFQWRSRLFWLHASLELVIGMVFSTLHIIEHIAWIKGESLTILDLVGFYLTPYFRKIL